jgi:AcrR family transcriptional regulator
MATARDTTRDRLVESARELLWQRGYTGTSPRAILDRAGAGQGSMYHHFAGKEDLAAAALKATSGQLLECSGADLTGGSAVERLTAYLLRRRDVLRGCPIGRMTGDAEVLDSPVLLEVVSSTFDRLRAELVAVVEAGVATGELDPGMDADDLADTVLAVVQGGYVLARAAGDPGPFDRAVRGAVALIGRLA